MAVLFCLFTSITYLYRCLSLYQLHVWRLYVNSFILLCLFTSIYLSIYRWWVWGWCNKIVRSCSVSLPTFIYPCIYPSNCLSSYTFINTIDKVSKSLQARTSLSNCLFTLSCTQLRYAESHLSHISSKSLSLYPFICINKICKKSLLSHISNYLCTLSSTQRRFAISHNNFIRTSPSAYLFFYFHLHNWDIQ